MQHLNTHGQPIAHSQVKQLVAVGGEVLCVGTLRECEAYAARHALTIGSDAVVQDVWAL